MLFEGGPVKDDNEEGKEGKAAQGQGSKSNSKAKSGDEEGDYNCGDYAIENAKSSRSTCKECNEKIEKGQVYVCAFSSRFLLDISCLKLSVSAKVFNHRLSNEVQYFYIYWCF